jgi:hypothetical protein
MIPARAFPVVAKGTFGEGVASITLTSALNN